MTGRAFLAPWPAAVSMALCLTACGGDGGAPTPRPTPTPAPTPAATPTPTPTPLACHIRSEPPDPIVPEIPAPHSGSPIVRAAYVIPSDRTPQPYGVAHLQEAIRMIHEFYGEQLARWGYGYRTFRYETESGSTTPKVYVIQTSRTAQWMVGSNDGYDLHGRAREAAHAAGATSIYAEGEIWIVIPETHVQQPDSSIRGNAWLGGPSSGLGTANGRATVGSEILGFFCLETCLDDRPLAGEIIPEVGPYPLTEEHFGGTYSERCGGATGGLAHELGHAFGLGHDNRPDWGDLMMYGTYRGWRFPEKYSEKGRLNESDALILATSPYFSVYRNGHPQEYTGRDITFPSLRVYSYGVESDGLMHIKFDAGDDVGLSSARLGMGGGMTGIVAEMALSGVARGGEFATPYYGSPWFEPGQPNEYAIYVSDTSRNTSEQWIHPIIGSIGNRAPEPRATTSPGSEVWTGRTVTFDASASVDHDGDTGFTYEWDIDGDGTFEVGPSTSATYSATFSNPTVLRIRARVTDPNGARSSTVPIALRVTADCNENGVADSRDILDGTSADADQDWVPDECP